MPETQLGEIVRELREADAKMEADPEGQAIDYARLCVRHMPAILDALAEKPQQQFGRCREMGGGMLMVFDWHETREDAEAAIPDDSPVKQFVISREALKDGGGE